MYNIYIYPTNLKQAIKDLKKAVGLRTTEASIPRIHEQERSKGQKKMPQKFQEISSDIWLQGFHRKPGTENVRCVNPDFQ